MARFTRVLLVLIAALTITSILWASLPTVPTGQWANSGPLAQARSGAAAVLLPDGRVMITGGDVNGNPSASVEMFNSDGSVSSAAPMSTARSGHSAFLLTTGEVLVTGGRTSSGGITNSAELYDPLEDAWTAAPAMQDARTGHTVLQLPDWTVLVVGGTNSSGPVSAVERYDPEANTFTHAGVLNHSRSDAAAAVLDDGRVLVAGGVMTDATGQSSATTSSEIFDPVTGTSSDAAALSVARIGASATTLFDGRIAVIGGNDGNNDLTSAEIYDPTAAAWGVVAGGAPRSHHLAVALPYNNSVLLTGGSAGTATDLFIPWANNNQGAFVSTATSGSSHNGGFGSPLSAEGLLVAGTGDAGAGTELYRFATVRTDQEDYAPGQTVTITGTGWKPGEQVTITLVESPNIDTHPAITATADANGNILDSSFTTDAHDFQIRFFVYAHGSASDAATSFTDGGGAVAVAGVSSTTVTTFSYTGFTDSNCTTVAGGQGQNFPKSVSVTGNTSANLGLGNANFFKVTIPTDPTGFRFNNWSNAASGTSRTTQCVAAGSGNNTTTVQANFVPANVATTLTLTVTPGTVSFGTTTPVSLQATLKDASNNPVAGASINFSVNGVAQSPASTTNANGVATFSYNASTLAASATAYPVSATFSAAVIGGTSYLGSSANSSLTVTKATPVITWPNPADITFGTALSATQLNATASANGNPVAGAFTYTPAAGTVLNAGNNQTLKVDFVPTDTTDFNSVLGTTALINVLKATPVITVTDPAPTYDGTAKAATASATGVGGAAVSGTFAFTYKDASNTPVASPTNAGTYSVTASFTSTDPNYGNAVGTGTLTIKQATPTVTVSGGPFTFDGNAHAATVTVTGVGGAAVSGSSAVTYDGVATVPTNAGTYAVAVTFTSADNNYNNATGSGSILINKANSITTVSGTFTFTYDANPHPATVSVTGAGGLSLTPDPIYSCGHAPINVADSGCTASYSFAGDDNHNPSSDSKTYIISKATPLVTVSGGPFTFDGNTHAATITVTGVGGAAVAGSVTAITYNGSPALPLHAGTYAVVVTFTSADNNYDNAMGSGSILINQASSTTVVTVGGGTTFIYDGNTHPATVSVTGAGGLSLTPAPNYSCGHAPINVADSGCIASYTYAGDIDHTGSSDAKTYSISKATPVLTINALAPVTIGNPTTISGTVKLNLLVPTGSVTITVNGISQVATIGVGGAYSTTFAAGTINVGSYSVSAAYSGDGNFNAVNNSGSVSLVVQYAVCYLYDQTKSVQHNATVPVKLQLCDAAGHNLSSSAITVTATSVTLVSGGSGTLEDSGNANPDDNFRYDPTLAGYIFNLSTKPLLSGTWILNFRTSNDAAGTSPYIAAFGVK